jgi:phage FluMu protein Com
MDSFGVQCLYVKEIRCKKCKRLLMKGEVKTIEIKCPKCGYIQKIKDEGGEGTISNKHQRL